MESKYIIYPKEEDIPLKTSQLAIKRLCDQAPFKYQLLRLKPNSTKEYLYVECTQCKQKIGWSRPKNKSDPDQLWKLISFKNQHIHQSNTQKTKGKKNKGRMPQKRRRETKSSKEIQKQQVYNYLETLQPQPILQQSLIAQIALKFEICYGLSYELIKSYNDRQKDNQESIKSIINDPKSFPKEQQYGLTPTWHQRPPLSEELMDNRPSKKRVQENDYMEIKQEEISDSYEEEDSIYSIMECNNE